MLEQILYIGISITLFGLFFYKMIKQNETIYVYILILQALGIITRGIHIIFSLEMGIFFKTITYATSIIIPIIVIFLEYRKISLINNFRIKTAKIYLTLGKLKKSKKILLSIIDKQQNNYEAHKMLAEIYEKEGGLRKSIDEYVICIEINKQDYESYYHVAILLNELNKNNEAVEMLSKLLNKKPDYYEASIVLSDLLIDKGQYKDAVTILNESLKYNPMSFELNYELGIAYTMLNDFKSAKEYYEKASMINSLQYNAKYSLAQIALLYKDLNLAEEYFTKTIDDEDLSADSYYELSKIKLIKGELDTAIKYINIAMDLNGKKISQKVKKEPLFMSIYTKISMPFNFEEPKPSKLTKKELIAKEHLENTSDITTNMGYTNFRHIKDEKNNIKERT